MSPLCVLVGELRGREGSAMGQTFERWGEKLVGFPRP